MEKALDLKLLEAVVLRLCQHYTREFLGHSLSFHILMPPSIVKEDMKAVFNLSRSSFYVSVYLIYRLTGSSFAEGQGDRKFQRMY